MDKLPGGLVEEAEVNPRSPLVPSVLSIQWSDLKLVLPALLYIFCERTWVRSFQVSRDTGQMLQPLLSTCLILSLGAALLNKVGRNLLGGRFIN